MADKKAGGTPEDIMKPAGMKPLLRNSKNRTVYAAIGLTKDKDGVVLLDYLVKPKKLLAMLKDEAKKVKLELDAPSLRFGTALVDTDVDAELVKFTVNKQAPGVMEVKLRDLLKVAGYKQVQIGVDEALESEAEEGEQQEGATSSAAPPPPPSAPPPPPLAPKQDPDALANLLKQLTLQIPKVADGDAAVQQDLVRLSTAAETTLAGGNLQQAETEIAALRHAMAAAMDAAKLKAAADGPASTVTFAKSRLAWLAARKKVESEIDKLRSEIVNTYKAQGIAAELETRYREKVAPLLNTWDESLADKLDEAANATDAATRAKLVGEAKAIMTRYAKYLAGDRIIGDLDNNPFVPLTIQKTIAGTLSMLSKAVH